MPNQYLEFKEDYQTELKSKKEVETDMILRERKKYKNPPLPARLKYNEITKESEPLAYKLMDLPGNSR